MPQKREYHPLVFNFINRPDHDVHTEAYVTDLVNKPSAAIVIRLFSHCFAFQSIACWPRCGNLSAQASNYFLKIFVDFPSFGFKRGSKSVLSFTKIRQVHLKDTKSFIVVFQIFFAER